MKLTINEKGKNVIIKVEDRIDTSNYEQFNQQLVQIIEDGKKFLVLDLADLNYISSSGLRVFLATLKSLRIVEGDLVLCCLNDKIKSIFEISGFLNLFTIENDLAKF
jgi:anti-anti-sigma factor